MPARRSAKNRRAVAPKYCGLWGLLLGIKEGARPALDKGKKLALGAVLANGLAIDSTGLVWGYTDFGLIFFATNRLGNKIKRI